MDLATPSSSLARSTSHPPDLELDVEDLAGSTTCPPEGAWRLGRRVGRNQPTPRCSGGRELLLGRMTPLPLGRKGGSHHERWKEAWRMSRYSEGRKVAWSEGYRACEGRSIGL